MAAYTAIAERATTDLSLVKQHLRITAGETTFDALLQVYLDAAKEMADDYCQNPFARYLSGTLTAYDIPKPIEIWLLKTVCDWYNFPEKDVTQVTIDQQNQTRRDLCYDVDYKMLKPYRREVGFGLTW
jgi:hypothetical protein